MICGVFDNDRASWGDPDADWPVFLAPLQPGIARDAFWGRERVGPVRSG